MLSMATGERRRHKYFCHCFMILTWDLMCRANNTETILIDQMQWHGDHLEIKLSPQKDTNKGEKKRLPRRLRANPQQPGACPIVALALYLGLVARRLEMNWLLFSREFPAQTFHGWAKQDPHRPQE
ncbi:unnamed protein product [Cylindrotheca closterium]|uniref:Uncharacterized protein n=1 Tax=Cylindrotheca closterium TaxID=2856 RepID=A0AAD2JHV5_9STRA|nr:unnamed protein product [Cylindrotheca closterium]